MPIYSLTRGNQKVNLLFVHIPKTGGTAVSHFLRSIGFSVHFGTEHHEVRRTMRCPPQHYDYAILESLFRLDAFNFSFAIVRDPFARIVSDYRWAMTKSTMQRSPMDFNSWLDTVIHRFDLDPYYLANHIKPQHNFVGPKIKKIYRFEEGLEATITDVLTNLGLQTDRPFALNKINASGLQNAVPMDVADLDSSAREKISDFYQRDLAEFGYAYPN